MDFNITELGEFEFCFTLTQSEATALSVMLRHEQARQVHPNLIGMLDYLLSELEEAKRQGRILASD